MINDEEEEDEYSGNILDRIREANLNENDKKKKNKKDLKTCLNYLLIKYLKILDKINN